MTTTIHQPHDKFFRAALSDKRVAQAFFECHLPDDIKNKVDLSKLKLRNDNYVDAHLKLAVTDMLFETTFQHRVGYLYLLVEHQSKPDKLMPFRMLKYIIAIMEQHLKTKQLTELPLVYPLLFYTGETQYNCSTDFFALFNDPQLCRRILCAPLQLMDVSQIPDENLRQNMWNGIMELCMKHVIKRDIVPFFENMVSLFRQAEQAGAYTYLQTVLTYLFTATEQGSKEIFIETARKHLLTATETTMITIAQQLEAEGMRKGVEKGIEKGEENTKKAIAVKMLQAGLPFEMISKLTDLSLTTIQELSCNKVN